MPEDTVNRSQAKSNGEGISVFYLAGLPTYQKEVANMRTINTSDVIDIQDYVETYIGESRPVKMFTLAEWGDYCMNKELPNIWDYPLSEKSHIDQIHEEDGTEHVLVRFADKYGGYEYRYVEVPEAA